MAKFIFDPEKQEYRLDTEAHIGRPGWGEYDANMEQETPLQKLMKRLKGMANPQRPNTLTMGATGPTMGAGMPSATYRLPDPGSANYTLSKYLQFSPSGPELPGPFGNARMMDANGNPVDMAALQRLRAQIADSRYLSPTHLPPY